MLYSYISPLPKSRRWSFDVVIFDRRSFLFDRCFRSTSSFAVTNADCCITSPPNLFVVDVVIVDVVVVVRRCRRLSSSLFIVVVVRRRRCSSSLLFVVVVVRRRPCSLSSLFVVVVVRRRRSQSRVDCCCCCYCCGGAAAVVAAARGVARGAVMHHHLEHYWRKYHCSKP